MVSKAAIDFRDPGEDKVIMKAAAKAYAEVAVRCEATAKHRRTWYEEREADNVVLQQSNNPLSQALPRILIAEIEAAENCAKDYRGRERYALE